MKTSLDKIVQMINFFAIKDGGSVNYIKVLKLIYLADKYMLRRYGRMITYDNYVAMKNGPVPSTVKDIARSIFDNERDFSRVEISTYLKSARDKEWQIESRRGFKDDLFSDAEIEAMEAVYGEFGKLGKWKLCDLTHNFYEWSKHNVDGDSKLSAPIEYVDFFESGQIPKLDQFFNPDGRDVQEKKKFFIQLITD